LSHALIRTVYPSGHLHTFEFHLQRSETARNEFKEHGLSDYVTVYHRDVCSDGFNLENVADAVFLDLPNPWKTLKSAKNAIKKEGGRICSFSPCIEQVQKTVLELTQLGFTDMYTIETLRKIYSVKKYEVNEFDFDMDVKPPRKEDESEAKECGDDTEKATTAKAKNNAKKGQKLKRKRAAEDADNGNDASDDDNNDDDDDDNSKSSAKHSYAAKPINTQPGHTGFLTFATLLHKDFCNK